VDKQEKQILKLMRIVPVFLVSVFFIIALLIVINNKIQNGEQDIKDTRESLLQIKKSKIKNELLALVRQINYQRRTAKKSLKSELKEKVDMAYEISMNIYKQNMNKDKKTVIKMIKDALRPIRFNNKRGYFFIYTMGLKNVLLPVAPEFEGEDFSGYRDIKGDYVVRNMAKLCKENSSTFYTWYWKKPDKGFASFEKIGYGRYFKPFEWFIGTGEYLVDFEKNLQNKIIKEVQDIKYNKNGYYFILSNNGKVLVGAEDNSSKFFVQKIVKFAKNGGGFVGGKISKKSNTITYIANLDGWGWIIGLSESLKNIHKKINTKEKKLAVQLNDTLIKLIALFAAIAILLLGLLYVLSQKSKQVFMRYKNTILNEMEKSKKQLILVQNQNKLASMGEMLGNISHQWKQPLNTLGISVSKMMLLEDEGYLTKEIMQKSLIRMEKNITYLSRTIDVFRDFFKPSEQIETFNLREELKSMTNVAQCSFEHSLIDISCVCEEDIFIRGDKKKLEQVFLNILNNAKDAILSNNIKNGKVEIKVLKEQDRAKITIQDNALGIPLDIKDKIFELYFTTKSQSKGTGVGLYMSKIIIENSFQGELNFENKNNGALFTVIIPITQKIQR